MMRIRWRYGATLLGFAALVVGCDSGITDPEQDLEGGVLATFRVSGEDFRVWVTNETTIQQILALSDGQSAANIPNGKLIEGAGPGGYNQPWTWHLDPEDIEMAESTIELCDGRPSLVDELLEEYLTGGRFCPWGAELIGVDDRR